MTPLVLVEDRGPVRVLALNRPEKLNALNTPLTQAVLDALRAADASAHVLAVVLTGQGRGFCAGADLREFGELTPDRAAAVAARARLTATLHGVFQTLRVPVIAAVNGAAMGGGAGLALACDMAVAADTAVFGYPEVTHGIVPAIVMAQLVRIVGLKMAFELAATGRRVPAHEALALRMVNAVVAPDSVMPDALALANQLAAVKPSAMAMTKSLVYGVADVPFAEALDLGRAANESMRLQEDR